MQRRVLTASVAMPTITAYQKSGNTIPGIRSDGRGGLYMATKPDLLIIGGQHKCRIDNQYVQRGEYNIFLRLSSPGGGTRKIRRHLAGPFRTLREAAKHIILES